MSESTQVVVHPPPPTGDVPMLDRRWADQREIDDTHESIGAEVDEAIAWAEKSQYPDPSELLENVYHRS